MWYLSISFYKKNKKFDIILLYRNILIEKNLYEKIDILIGTQMVTKGLDFPNVTLVGVLAADMSLYADDYRAGERTFQLLAQAAGRAGRGREKGQVVIQTYQPDHYSIQYAAKQDYDSFYELELQLRKVQGVPPFGTHAGITFLGQDEGQVLRGAAKFRDSLNACLCQPGYEVERCTVLGPAPCPVPKINYNFRYRITMRCPMDRSKRALLAHLLREFSKDKLNRGVSAFVDVNGFD